MSESSRNGGGGAVEQIMRNMTSDIHNADGQYMQLGFTPPPTPQETWSMPSHPQSSYISPYNIHPPEHPMQYPIEHQYSQPQVPYNFIQQPQLYNQDPFDKRVGNGNDLSYMYPNHGVQDVMFTPDYKLFMSQKIHYKENNPNHGYLPNQDEMILPNNQNRTPLIDNLVGNWAPNTSGTYSPFGNVASFNTSNIFESVQDMDCLSNNVVRQVLEDPKSDFDRPDEIPNFQFGRDTKRPRMVAEVKPMRPSYSDVLLKSAPQTQIKPNKSEAKETKQKKDIKKNIKNEKVQKVTATLNRSNTSNEIREAATDKNATLTRNEKNVKDGKSSNLNRKWASLDNVTETSTDFKNELSEGKKTKKNTEGIAKGTVKPSQKKVGKNESVDTDSGGGKSDAMGAAKASLRKTGKVAGRQRVYESSFGGGERPPGKRSQRVRKRDNQVPFGALGQKVKEYLGWWKYIVKFFFWLLHLVSDILSLSLHLGKDMSSNMYIWFVVHWACFLDGSLAVIKRIRLFSWIYDKFKKEKEPEKKNGFFHPGLLYNMNMPTTGEEAMKRLLACKGKDPYSILGVTPTCTDSDIKNYYKKQAKLVHPDKNQQPGAEEAFKILVHAFDMIGEPERRAAYDRGVAESAQAEQAMTELTELLVQLQQKVEAAANTIRCSACGLRHKRVKIDRPSYAARNCTTCKIHHAAKEGDIWAEARCFGFLWYYYACMDGGVYDITEWAGCQKDSLRHLRPDSHNVQYRIALGKQTNGPQRRHAASPRNDRCNPDLDNLFNSFYGQEGGGTQNPRRRPKKAK